MKFFSLINGELGEGQEHSFRPNVVWDKEKNQVLCQFVNGVYETDDEREIAILKDLGYEGKEGLPKANVKTGEFVCPYCGKVCKNALGLSSHMRGCPNKPTGDEPVQGPETVEPFETTEETE